MGDREAAARQLGVERLDVADRSVAGGGKAGVSDAFASALWGYDYALQTASAGYLGVNLHVRYSTTGETALRNVQPLYAELASGGFAVAHNGNISNAFRLRNDLVQRGAIFQSTSDTEVIIHLVATSSYRDPLDKFVDALRRVEGAY